MYNSLLEKIDKALNTKSSWKQLSDEIQRSKEGSDELKSKACEYPELAVAYAEKFGQDKDTLTAACKEPDCANKYADHVQKKVSDVTRTAACKNPIMAYEYAEHIEKSPNNETRSACCKDPYLAFMYALYIDKSNHSDTRKACSGTEFESEYEKRFGTVLNNE